LKNLVQLAVEEARRAGAQYVDARGVERREEVLRAHNDEAFASERDERGIGVRARSDGAWGYAATATLEQGAVRQAAREAVSAARASAILAPGGAELAAGRPGAARYETSYGRDPFQVPLADKIALVSQAAQAARRLPVVRVARCRILFVREHTWIATSDARLCERILRWTGAGLRVVAVDGRRIEVRTAPAVGGGVWAGGYEVLEQVSLFDLAARAAEEARDLVRAPPCPEGARDVVLDPWLVARLVHETLGHALLADRPSFVSPAQVGQARVGSRSLHLVQDPSIEGSPGTLGADDEGVAPRGVTLVSEGVLAGFLSDRESAAPLELPSTGSARAAGFREPPQVRLTTLAMGTGVGDAISLFGGGDGIYLEGARGYTVDRRRTSFRLAAEVAWEIRGGKRARMLRGAALGGSTVGIWDKLDGVGGIEAREMCGLWCEMGPAGQRVGVGHRMAPVRLRQVALGPVGG
jgi:TldD protein